MGRRDGSVREAKGRVRPGGLAVWALRRLDRRSTSRGREPFDALEVGVLRALVPVLLPVSREVTAVREAAGEVEEALQGLDDTTLAEVRATLVWLDIAPWRLGPRRARLTALTAVEVEQFVQAWSVSRVPDERARWEVFRGIVLHVGWPREEG